MKSHRYDHVIVECRVINHHPATAIPNTDTQTQALVKPTAHNTEPTASAKRDYKRVRRDAASIDAFILAQEQILQGTSKDDLKT